MAAFALSDYPERFSADEGEQSPLAEYRRRAFDDLASQGLPTGKTEDWKYTSVRRLVSEQLLPATTAAPVAVPEIDARHLAVMVNGCLNERLSRLEDLPEGVRLTGFRTAMEAGSRDRGAGAGGGTRTPPLCRLQWRFFRGRALARRGTGNRDGGPRYRGVAQRCR